MSEYQFIKDLVVDACMSEGELPSYDGNKGMEIKGWK